jgi:luciferase family oxidoreductase group 1
MRLSILDQSPIAEGGNGGQALRNSIELAKLGDALGYHRFWMAEHHATPALASASPELMLAAIGLQTERIRLGTGGIMLPHYSPFKVAESFSMLSGLLPGRIDLGLGRAPGSDQMTAYALQQDRRQRAPNAFPQQLGELLGYYDDSFAGDHPFRNLAKALPGSGEQPEIWVLGSSGDSAELAGAMGLPYCIADFIAGEVPELAHRYRDAFRPSPRAAEPSVMVACWVVAADTSERAEWLAGPSRMMFAHLNQGQLISVPHPDKAADWLSANPAPVANGRRPIIGTAQNCLAALRRKAQIYGADEVMLVNILHDHADRMESYRLMAQASAAGEGETGA